MDIDRLLQLMVEKAPPTYLLLPVYRLHEITRQNCAGHHLAPLAGKIPRNRVLHHERKQRAEFVERKELNFAISVRGVAAFAPVHFTSAI